MDKEFCLFFFNDTATTEIYTLSLHDALPIYTATGEVKWEVPLGTVRDLAPIPLPIKFGTPNLGGPIVTQGRLVDRKSTRLNSSHANISYAVFCLKKNNKIKARSIFDPYDTKP